MALQGRIPRLKKVPVFILFNNFGSIFDMITTSDPVSLQQKFTDSINQSRLCPIGSVIVAFCPLDLQPPNWSLSVHITDLPKYCLGWHLNPHDNFKIYKYKRVHDVVFSTRTSTRTNVVPTETFIFCNYLKNAVPIEFV